ncbi:MAG: O-antigen ligase family protein [Draconibacterium sp.]
MKNYLSKIFNANWFFATLVLFVLALPFSEALVSIIGGMLLLLALIEDSWENKLKRLVQNKNLLFLTGVFFIYLFSSIATYNHGESLYDIKKNLFYLVIPLAFVMGKSLNDIQKRFLFYSFLVAVSISIFVSLIRWSTDNKIGSFEVHNISLISHIRFSFQLILAFWVTFLLYQKNSKIIANKYKILLIILCLYILSFLFFQQSLTGIIAFGSSVAFYLFHQIFKLKKKYRIVLFLITGFLIVAPIFYVFSIIKSFYSIEQIDCKTIDKKTKLGNDYVHDFDNPMVENGRYVFLYICESEMREEWNKISEFKYDSIGINGYVNSSTLIRYLTSKGYRKDAEGVKKLNKQDIKNIEDGIANVIYQEKKYSLYPRIYQTIWEYYFYSKTGNANYQSFSQRLEFSKAALTIIKQNFWLGVGTGNWREEFKNAYQENHSNLSEELYASSHNQYLNYMVKFGLIGFLLIMFFMIYPIIKSKRYNDILFLIFLFFLFFSNFGDSNFESHMGNSFFIFFYCLFIITGTSNCLILREQ